MTDERESSVNPDLTNFEIVEPQEGSVRAYANLSHLTWTGSDLTVDLYQLEQPNRELPKYKDNPNRLLHTASVTLTWASAKTFHQFLGDILTRYEKVYGPINTDFKQI
jgi:hypothetical protein